MGWVIEMLRRPAAGRRAAALVTAVLAWGLVGPASRALADDDSRQLLCVLLAERERSRWDDRELLHERTEEFYRASGKELAMLDELAARNAVERLAHLRGQRAHMRNRLAVERGKTELEEQSAVIESYQALCVDSTEAAAAEDERPSAEASYLRYREAECRLVENDLAVGRGDLRYGKEILEAFRDMLEANVVTRLEVIRAEMDVDLAEATIALSERRLRQCRAEIGELKRPPTP